jgi:FAD synthase
MDYKISGTVVKGDGYGRKLGFPTVNLDPVAHERQGRYPTEGVYAGLAILENKEYKAGIVVGPEIDGQKKIEAHLIGYSADAYGKIVQLDIKKFIREFKKFDTEEELIIQIKKDLELCK